ncbi:MAG: phosphomethylpyrimidine synthase, partial [Bradyrhizobium sp.]
MNIRSNPDATLPAVTTGPLPSSRKIFVTADEAADVRVPLREIILSEGAGEPNLPVYDTSGPYTDPDVVIDVNAGLPRNRIAWVKERGGVEEYDGRAVKPVDNGNVSADKAAKAFTAHHRPLRGMDAPSVPSPLAGEGQGGGSTRKVRGATPTPDPSPQGGGEQRAARGERVTETRARGEQRAASRAPMITQLEFARAGIITKEMIYVAARENLGRKLKLE